MEGGKGKWKCYPCGKSFTRKHVLKLHQNRPNCKLFQPSKDADGNIIQQIPKYKCDKCEATFTTQYNLDRHFKLHAIPDKAASLASREMNYDLTTLEERAELKCVPCEVKFKGIRALYRHKKRNKCNKIKLGLLGDQNKPSCKLSRPPKDEKVNIICLSEKPRFTCDPCGKSYTTNESLRYHQNGPSCKLYQPPKDAVGYIIQQIPKYKCDKCEATFPTQYRLNRHLKKHTNRIEMGKSKFNCDPCGKSYTRRSKLKIHQNGPNCKLYKTPKDADGDIIQQIPKYKCDPCGKSYKFKRSLKEHQNQPNCKLYQPPTDSDGKIIPYCKRHKCDKCDAIFGTKGALTSHLRRHTNTIKFNCDPCGKSYRRKFDLKLHQNQPNCKLYQPLTDADGNIIQQIPKYKCEPCGKSYNLKKSLKKHQNQPNCKLYQPPTDANGNIIPYCKRHKCDECDAIFGTKGALASHLRRHTNTIKFNCDPCGKIYKTKEGLKYHQNGPSCKLYQPPKDADGNIIQQIPKYKCDKCEATFPTQYSLNRHLKKHLIPKKDARFRNKKMIHTITTLEERAELKCVPCEVKFTGICALYRHKKRNKCNQIKDAPTEFKCPRCNKTFSRKEDLNYHLSKNKCTKGEPKNPIKSEGRKPIYKCKLCEKLFSSKSVFSRHKTWTCPINHMDPDGNISPRVPSFLCDKCGSIYKTRDSLKRHRDDGGCERKLDQPKKEQTLEEKLNGPEKLESLGATEQSLEPNPWFECDICYKRFSLSRSLIRHQKGSHSQYLALKASGEFVCKYCLIVFADEQQLRCHCASGCIKAKKRSLTNHQLIYTCEKFDLKETVSESLNEKSDKDELKVQFFCWWCCDQLPTQAEMVNHMETVHHKEIAKEKLTIADEETLKIDPAKPKIHCCYICLRKFTIIIPTVICIRSCERDIGVSMEGFVPPTERLRQNKMNERIFNEHLII